MRRAVKGNALLSTRAYPDVIWKSFSRIGFFRRVIKSIGQNESLSMVSGFREQTVEKRGSLVFRICESSEAERERVEPPERMSEFARKGRHNAHPYLRIWAYVLSPEL